MASLCLPCIFYVWRLLTRESGRGAANRSIGTCSGGNRGGTSSPQILKNINGNGNATGTANISGGDTVNGARNVKGEQNINGGVIYGKHNNTAGHPKTVKKANKRLFGGTAVGVERGGNGWGKWTG
eukprot:UN12874